MGGGTERRRPRHVAERGGEGGTGPFPERAAERAERPRGGGKSRKALSGRQGEAESVEDDDWGGAREKSGRSLRAGNSRSGSGLGNKELRRSGKSRRRRRGGWQETETAERGGSRVMRFRRKELKGWLGRRLIKRVNDF